ncbi:MAG: acyltransferase [Chloroflexi bacterium]|nr:acyltransferase [Chloroflexota bacterium]
MTTITRPAPPAPPPSPASPVSARLPALDFVRAAATAGVIAIHVLAWAGRDTPDAALWYRILDLFTRLSVPSFVILTGMVLGYGAQEHRPAPRAFLMKRLERIGVPWLFWAAVWCMAWLVAAPLWSGDPSPTLAEAALALAQGPGYLYFLLLIMQLSAVFVLFPVSLRGRIAVAGIAVALQLALSIGRLAIAEPSEVFSWLLGEGAYEFGPYWIGYFALGVLAGSATAHLNRPTLKQTAGAAAVAALGFAALVCAPLFGWWDADRLTGANTFLHPLMLPVACAATLLLYWGSSALLRFAPRLTGAVEAASAASFGVYLTHQYVLDLLGPLLQQTDVSALSEPLPVSLPALSLLYVLTLAGAVALLALLRRYRRGRLVLGDPPAPPRR